MDNYINENDKTDLGMSDREFTNTIERPKIVAFFTLG